MARSSACGDQLDAPRPNGCPLELQLQGYRLATAEIVYHMPDHPGLLQTFVWQHYDSQPALSRAAQVPRFLVPEHRRQAAQRDGHAERELIGPARAPPRRRHLAAPRSRSSGPAGAGPARPAAQRRLAGDVALRPRRRPTERAHGFGLAFSMISLSSWKPPTRAVETCTRSSWPTDAPVACSTARKDSPGFAHSSRRPSSARSGLPARHRLHGVEHDLTGVAPSLEIAVLQRRAACRRRRRRPMAAGPALAAMMSSRCFRGRPVYVCRRMPQNVNRSKVRAAAAPVRLTTRVAVTSCRARRSSSARLCRARQCSRFEDCLMARRCTLTRKGVLTGNNVSHANNKTRRRFLPNLQSRRLFSETLRPDRAAADRRQHAAHDREARRPRRLPAARPPRPTCPAIWSG